MEFRHLRYFHAVAEELSFSKAARRLRIAQPALSRAVQELEAEVGSLLLDRSRRAMRLTPGGEVMLREAGFLFERLDDAVRKVRRAAAGEEGELRLGYIGPPTRGFLGGLLKAFHLRYPRITIVLEERTPERVWEMVSKGRLSVGLTRPVLAHEALGLQSLLLCQEQLCAAVPSTHRLAGAETIGWGELAREDIVILARREGAGSHDTILAACAAAGFTPHLAHTPSVISTILRYVEAGSGIGIVPESVAPESDEVVLIPLVPRETLPVVMVWSREGDDPAVTAFRGIVEEWLTSR
ncbi:MAG: LysR family transcriptional regulator [Verrucomicrobiia bacterium Tous-C2TDCM]|nr:MAG: LysR family transcriptional regulator [Verrucomicrobiae bacterium Tous-C2TDCM]